MTRLVRHDVRRAAAAMCVAASALWAPMAHAGFFDDDDARKAILDLRERIEQGNEQSRKALAEQTAQLNDQISQLKRSLLDLNSQIETLRADLAKLRGQDEQLTRDIADLQRRQKDIAQGVDERVSKLEPQKVTQDGKEFTADPEEKRSFDDALAVFRKGDFAGAAAAFASFQRRYPQSGFNDAATFWAGNAQYGLRDYKSAIALFRALVRNAPDNARAPEALLSIANCQVELKDTKSARRTIDELLKSYPQSEAAQAGRERLSSLKS